MTITNGYCTFEQLNGWLSGQIPSGQSGEAETAITAASRWIDQYCGRHFFQATAATRTFRPDSGYGVTLGCDLVSVTTLKTDAGGDGTFETTWSASDYQLLTSADGWNVSQTGETRPYRLIEAIGSLTFPVRCSARRDTVQIVGTFGWSAVPEPVKQACLIEAAGILNRKQSVGGVAGISDFGVVRVGSQTDPHVAALLAPYRISFGIA